MKETIKNSLEVKNSLALKVFILTLIISSIVWILLGHFQTIQLRQLFTDKFIEDLQVLAQEDKKHFDRHIQKIQQAAQLITEQSRFQTYVFVENWLQNKSVKKYIHTELPPWLPPPSTLHAFFNIKYALLSDSTGKVREIFVNSPKNLPELLLNSEDVLQKLNHNQSYMLDIQGFPHIFFAESVFKKLINGENSEEKVATLILAFPLDSDFLKESQENVAHRILSVLLNADTQKVVASSDSNFLKEGMYFADFKDKFLKVSSPYPLNFDTTTPRIEFYSFIKTDYISDTANYLALESHKQKAILVLVLIFAFSTIVFWITQRIRRMTRKIVDFSERKLGISTSRMGDEIDEIVLSFENVQKAIEHTIIQANTIAAGVYDREVQLLSEHDPLGLALSDMTDALRHSENRNIAQDWLKTGQMKLNDRIRDEQEISDLAKNILDFLIAYLPAQVGLFYCTEYDKQEISLLKLKASCQYTNRKVLENEFYLGQGLVGQAALERQAISVSDESEEFIVIDSQGKNVIIRNIIAIPFMYENSIKGVIKLGFINKLTATQREFLELTMRNIAIAVNTAESREKMRGLLQKTQMQSKELRIQKEELQTQAEELQAQAEELQTQTAELQAQQEELLKINEDLNQHTQKLEHQRQEILEKNIALEKTQVAVELKSKELELASRYKSEFLANMSHELRTPLNSILILAQLLSKNSQSNLTEKQVEYAKTILQSGSDLLVLISEVLDLSKVEAGKIEVHIENLPLVDLVGRIESKFRSLAEQKGLNFHVSLAKNLPLTIQTDTQRLQQILNNLLSNAFKFTAQGEVKLTVQRQTANELTNRGLSHSLKVLTFNVLDTGIGIPENKKEVIFEAFRQADGKTSRQFGGTGLGLTITRQLARILGGDVKVESEVGKGSIFTLYLPETQGYVLSDSVKTDVLTLADSAIKTQQKGEFIPDDRNNIEENDKVILIIENDPKFSNILVELAREKNFKAVVAENGKKGLQFVKEYAPSAIMLDVGLPTIDGWTVMERLKDDSETRHIPVHFIAASGQKLVAKKMGAIGYLLKPSTIDKLREAFDKIECFIAKKQKNLLVIAHGEFRVQKIMDIVNMDNICIVTESTLADAVQKIKEIPFDCIILDVDVRDCSNMSFLRERKNKEQLLNIPIITYISRELTAEEDILWKQCTGELALKTVRSPERLLDETTLFLHQSEADLPQDKRSMLQLVYDKGSIFKGKRILLVDDDARNVFALATVLEDKEMEVIVSKNGREALNALETESNISIILMDIMMPEMDGYETMRKIRENENFRKLPIIALTAKAMKGDKAKCIESGANDYLSKPVDTDRLMSLMRVWLYQ